MIKATLALEHSYIPATIGVNKLNAKIKSTEWNVEVVSKGRPWPIGKHGNSLKRVSINSFGYGGANAHAILENADIHVPPYYGTASQMPNKRKTFLLPFSATTKQSLEARVMDMAKYNFESISIADLAYTLGVRRSHFVKRGFIVVNGKSVGDKMSLDYLCTLPSEVSDSPSRYAFVFTGQGAQWPQMGKELFDEFAVFCNSVSEMDSVLQSLPHPPNWRLREAILGPERESKIGKVTHSQPICTALQIGLVQLLSSWNITPSAVLGHSCGEIAAAFAAGHLSLAEAITAAYYRGYVVGKDTKQGAMMAAGLSREQAESEINLAGLEGKICVACVNSTESTTLSGDENAVDSMLQILQERKLFARKLKTGGRAYHSHHMWALGDEYQRLLTAAFEQLDSSIKLPAGAQFISSVTGEPLSLRFGPAYWRSNLENPVLFADAVIRLTQEGDFHLVEIGPHSALELPIKQIRSKVGIPEERLPYSTAITRGKDSVESVLSLAGRLFIHGNNISIGDVNELDAAGKSCSMKRTCKVIHDLPTYPWHYDGTLWNECRASIEFRNRKYPRHELLGSKIPGVHDLENTWRNVVKVGDIKWLIDHKLQETVVFPGAAYIAMAIEGLSQLCDYSVTGSTTMRLQNVNILTALALSTEPTTQVELFTTLRPTPITVVSNSRDWWDFSIVSFTNGVSTTHAAGSISIDELREPMRVKYQATAGALEPSAARTWYDRLIKVGLNFGKTFQSIAQVHIPRMRSIQHCTADLPLLQGSIGDDESSPVYAIHPITIDAMLQTAIIATSAGNTRDLRAKIPTRIGSAVITMPQVSAAATWSVNALAKVIGFGAAEINAELTNQSGQVSMQLENVRLAPYKAASQLDNADKRHPMLRVLWKPDLHGLALIQPDDLTRNLDAFAAESHSEITDEGLLKLGATLNLISHKNPRIRILELGNDIKEITNAALALLLADNAFPRLHSYGVGRVDEKGVLLASQVNLNSGLTADSANLTPVSNHKFDLVLLPNASTADEYLDSRLDIIKEFLSDDGLVLALSKSTGDLFVAETKFQGVLSPLSDGSGRVVLARHLQSQPLGKKFQGKPVILVDRGLNVLVEVLLSRIPLAIGQDVKRVAFEDVTMKTVPQGAILFALVESEKPLLSVTTDEEMERVKILTNNASVIVWVTSGDLLSGTSPEFALVSGLSRALMLEQPSLKFFTFDVDDIYKDTERTADSIISVLKQSNQSLDYEFILKHGVIHVSRFVPDDDLNNHFRQKQGEEKTTSALETARPAEIAIETPGQFDTIYFKQINMPERLDPQQVQVEIKAIGLNAKDFYALSGKVDTKDATCILEYCGIVERIGSEVRSVLPGDRVVVMAPSRFKTSQISPDWACRRLRDDEDFNTLCTIPMVYATTLYALRNRANIQPGESVLIHSAAGGVGIAAIQIAQLTGAEVSYSSILFVSLSN